MTRARDLADSADKDISGTLTVDDLTASGDVSVGGNLSVSGTTTTIDSANAQTVDLGDNDKIRLGDGDDLQIYHSGSHSYITDGGTGSLLIQGSDLVLEDPDGNNYLHAVDGGAVQLYNNGSSKLATTSTGVTVGPRTLAVDGAAASDGPRLNLDLDGTNKASILLNRTTEDLQFTVVGNNMMSFTTNSSERMRIDSSGRVLINTTASSDPAVNNVDNAIRLASDTGRVSASAVGTTALILNRKSSDGEIAQFRRAGTSVGSIGTNGGRLHIGSTEGDDCFIGFGNSIVRPTNSAGSSRDANTDLGYTGMRFKDLYLSGGAYLGGTGASNKLEDYEEGNWTPVFGGTGGTPSASYSAQTGVYTKVGRIVYASAMLSWSGKSGGSGQLVIAGLPFAGSGSVRGVASIAYNDGGITGSNGNILLHSNTASNYIYFMVPDSNFQSGTYMDTSYMEAAGHFQIAIVYST